MNNRVVILFLSLLIANTGFSQQNFFNVPSSDITPKQKLFFQEQFNFAETLVQSGTTFSYGLGKDFEMGINILAVNYTWKRGFLDNNSVQPYAPFFTLNLQKKVELDSLFSLALGTQTGFTTLGKFGAYTYLNSIYANKKLGLKLVGGLYYTTDSYFGAETRSFTTQADLRKIGLQVGFEKNVWKDRMFLQTDFISGKHSVGEIVIGVAYYVNTHWIYSLGYQQPTFNSKSQKSVVFEITYAP